MLWFRKHLTHLVLVLTPADLIAAEISGDWRTIDDETGRAKSIVRITETAEGTLQGRVVEILHSDRGPDPLCEECPGERRGQPIRGMVILWDLKAGDPGEWTGGRILDPTRGKVYRARLRLLEDGRLEVRGYLGISLLGRSQVWQRADAG